MATPNTVKDEAPRQVRRERSGSVPTTFAPSILLSRRYLPLTLLVLLLAPILVRLGFWQLDRYEQRTALNARVAARMEQPPLKVTGPLDNLDELEFRAVEVSGAFDYANEIFLGGRSYGGRPGYHLLTPLVIDGADQAVLVDRGWIPIDQAEAAAGGAFRGPETGTVRGLVRYSQDTPARQAVSAPTIAGNQRRREAWIWIDIARFQQDLPYQLLPFYIQRAPETATNQLPIAEEPPVLNAGMNLGYAGQWFTFAVILVVGYIVAFGRRPINDGEGTRAAAAHESSQLTK